MAEHSEREVLHHLIEVCEDGERGLRAAADYVRDPELKRLFSELAEQRHAFVEDLLPHLQRLGGRTDGGGTRTGAIHRGWMNARAHVPGHPDDTIVAEAERGEHAAINAYDEALNGILPPTVTPLVELQRRGLQIAFDRVHAFCPVS